MAALHTLWCWVGTVTALLHLAVALDGGTPSDLSNYPVIRYLFTPPDTAYCLYGNTSYTLSGCLSNSTIGIRFHPSWDPAAVAIRQIVLSRRNASLSNIPIPCNLSPDQNVTSTGILYCMLGKVDVDEPSTYSLRFLLGVSENGTVNEVPWGAVPEEVSVELIPTLTVSRTTWDERCVKMFLPPFGLPTPTLPVGSTASPEPPADWAVAGCYSKSIVTFHGSGFSQDTHVRFRQSPPEGDTSEGACENLELPTCKVVNFTSSTLACQLNFHTVACAVPGSQIDFQVVHPTIDAGNRFNAPAPPIALLTAPRLFMITFLEEICDGNETLVLSECQSSGRVTLHGQHLSVPGAPVSVTLAPHGRSAKGVALQCELAAPPSHSRISCTLPDVPTQRTYTLAVTVNGMKARTTAVVSILPRPSVDNVTGCAAAARDGVGFVLTGCSNNSRITFAGRGLVASGESAVALSNPNCTCEVESVLIGWITCSLSCNSFQPLTLVGTVSTKGGLSKQQVTLSFEPPPVITAITVGGITSNGPVQCRTGDVITLHGIAFDPRSSVVRAFAVGEGERDDMAAAKKFKNMETQPSVCDVLLDQSNASVIVCRLAYESVLLSDTGYGVVVSSNGGSSVDPLLESQPGPWVIPRLSLRPSPVITGIVGCLRGMEERSCLAQPRMTLTITGRGFGQEQERVRVHQAPGKLAKDGPFAAAMNLLSEWLHRNVTQSEESTFNVTKQSPTALEGTVVGNDGPVALQVENIGGVSNEYSLLLLPIPAVTKVEGCEVLSDTEAGMLSKLREQGEAAKRVVLGCRRMHQITFTGHGLLGEIDVHLIPLDAVEGSARPPVLIERSSATQVVATLNHTDHSGLFTVQLHTFGRPVAADVAILLHPSPSLSKLKETSTCIPPWRSRSLILSQSWAAGASTQTVMCRSGEVIEVQGRNLDKVSKVVLQGTSQKINDTFTVQGIGKASQCAVVNRSSTTVLCRLAHSVVSGPFEIAVTTPGGTVTSSHLPPLYPIPVPEITAMMYNKAYCQEGNGTKDLTGCHSGARITLKGHNFQPAPYVRMQRGSKGGTNGPPECVVLMSTAYELQCYLQHTSAAGAFEVQVQTEYGNSTLGDVAVSVIPGNLYLLFKNTRLVLMVSNIFGWLCTILWAGQGITLAYDCFVRQSVSGLTSDMVLYNVVGITSWTIFSTYFFVHNDLGITTTIQDVVYSFIGMFCMFFLAFEVHVFHGAQPLTTFAKLYVVMVVFWVVKGSVDGGSQDPRLFIPEFVKRLSYIHLGCSAVKYIPQAMYNYKRKSTAGYSIMSVWFDTCGAALLLLQMFFDGIIRHKWSLMITLNFPKFSLACEVIFFNVVYLTQHYILYNKDDLAKQSDCEIETPKAISSGDSRTRFRDVSLISPKGDD
eukprot:Sspe_Gene.103429::Locus_79242_Transcript_1_1_Confidence_1.000_Length_4376::g.103429::m.103429